MKGLLEASRYASPALGICKSDLPEKETLGFRNRIDRGGSFTDAEYAHLFPHAYKHIAILCQQAEKKMWNLEIVREYWETMHNRITDHPDCETKTLIYDTNSKVRIPKYLNIKNSDTIITHLNTAIKKYEN